MFQRIVYIHIQFPNVYTYNMYICSHSNTRFWDVNFPKYIPKYIPKCTFQDVYSQTYISPSKFPGFHQIQIPKFPLSPFREFCLSDAMSHTPWDILYWNTACVDNPSTHISSLRNRPNQEILVPDWLITSHVSVGSCLPLPNALAPSYRISSRPLSCINTGDIY